MSDTYGKSVTLTIFGESHGPAVGATVTGLAPGVPVDMEFMRGQMEKRRAKGKISTSRTEAGRRSTACSKAACACFRAYTGARPRVRR